MAIRFGNAFRLAASILAIGATFNIAVAAGGADEAAIRTQSVEWAKAYNGGDAAGVAAQYADDALLLPPGAKGVRGKAAIQAFFTKDIAMSKAAGVVFHITPGTEVGVAGDTGWESGTYSVTVGDKVVETGKFLSVSRKHDGKWHYLRDTWNSDTAPAAATPK